MFSTIVRNGLILVGRTAIARSQSSTIRRFRNGSSPVSVRSSNAGSKLKSSVREPNCTSQPISSRTRRKSPDRWWTKFACERRDPLSDELPAEPDNRHREELHLVAVEMARHPCIGELDAAGRPLVQPHDQSLVGDLDVPLQPSQRVAEPV